MPALDGTGPFGRGPQGRGRGNCLAETTDNFPGRRGFRRGGGMGQGMGRGFGNRFRGVCRFFQIQNLSREEQIAALKEQIKFQESRLRTAQERLQELERTENF